MKFIQNIEAHEEKLKNLKKLTKEEQKGSLERSYLDDVNSAIARGDFYKNLTSLDRKEIKNNDYERWVNVDKEIFDRANAEDKKILAKLISENANQSESYLDYLKQNEAFYESVIKNPESDLHNTYEADVINERLKKRVPDSVKNKYIYDEERGNFYLKGQEENAPTIKDRGKKLITKLNNPSTAIDVVAIAEARGWEDIKVSGTASFRREAWLHAELKGIAVKGYSPSAKDLAELNQMREVLRENFVENISEKETILKDEPVEIDGKNEPVENDNKRGENMKYQVHDSRSEATYTADNYEDLLNKFNEKTNESYKTLPSVTVKEGDNEFHFNAYEASIAGSKEKPLIEASHAVKLTQLINDRAPSEEIRQAEQEALSFSADYGIDTEKVNNLNRQSKALALIQQENPQFGEKYNDIIAKRLNSEMAVFDRSKVEINEESKSVDVVFPHNEDEYNPDTYSYPEELKSEQEILDHVATSIAVEESQDWIKNDIISYEKAQHLERFNGEYATNKEFQNEVKNAYLEQQESLKATTLDEWKDFYIESRATNAANEIVTNEAPEKTPAELATISALKMEAVNRKQFENDLIEKANQEEATGDYSFSVDTEMASYDERVFAEKEQHIVELLEESKKEELLDSAMTEFKKENPHLNNDYNEIISANLEKNLTEFNEALKANKVNVLVERNGVEVESNGETKFHSYPQELNTQEDILKHVAIHSAINEQSENIQNEIMEHAEKAQLKANHWKYENFPKNKNEIENLYAQEKEHLDSTSFEEWKDLYIENKAKNSAYEIATGKESKVSAEALATASALAIEKSKTENLTQTEPEFEMSEPDFDFGEPDFGDFQFEGGEPEVKEPQEVVDYKNLSSADFVEKYPERLGTIQRKELAIEQIKADPNIPDEYKQMAFDKLDETIINDINEEVQHTAVENIEVVESVEVVEVVQTRDDEMEM